MGKAKVRILDEIQSIDRAEEVGTLLSTNVSRILPLREEFFKKIREEAINLKQRSRYQWLKDGDRNLKFFHRMASTRSRSNRTNVLMDGEER